MKPHHTTDNLRLRDEPNTSSLIATTLSKGEAVQVLETGEVQTIDGITASWVKVLSGSGFVGWCFSGYLEATETARAVAVSEPAPAAAPAEAEQQSAFRLPWLIAIIGAVVLVVIIVVVAAKRKKT